MIPGSSGALITADLGESEEEESSPSGCPELSHSQSLLVPTPALLPPANQKQQAQTESLMLNPTETYYLT